MTPHHESRESSNDFGRLCERYAAACGGLMLLALAYSALGFDPPGRRGESAMTMMIGLIFPAGLAASFAITLRGARQARLAWISVMPFVLAVALAYAGWFRPYL